MDLSFVERFPNDAACVRFLQEDGDCLAGVQIAFPVLDARQLPGLDAGGDVPAGAVAGDVRAGE